MKIIENVTDLEFYVDLKKNILTTFGSTGK